MIDSRVRIVFQHEGQPHFFVRFINEQTIDAVPFDQIRQAILFRRDVAVDLCKKINARGFQAQVITPGGVILYGEATAPPPPTPKTDDRVAMQCNGVLIVPGTSGWFIRFPGSPFESIRADSPDEAYRKLVEHPMAKTLLPLAERYIAPPEPDMTSDQVLQAVEREKYSGRRMRPGNR